MARLITNYKGSVLVEVMLSSSILLVISLFIFSTIAAGRESVHTAGFRSQAAYLAEEALEAVRNIRDADYTNLSNGTYGIQISGGVWTLNGSSDTIDDFTRSITIADGPSENVKAITTTINWQQTPQRTGSISLVTYLANWLIDKAITGIGDWTNPAETVTLDLTGSNDGVKIAVQDDYAYIVRASGTDFMVIDISDPTSPSVAAGITVAGTPADVEVSGNYAYIASNDNSAELIIVDISTPTSPSVIGTYDANGNSNATAVDVISTTVYLTKQANGSSEEFFIINASTPSSPVLVGTEDLSSNPSAVVISGDYAFISSNHNTQEVQIIDISTPSSPTLDNTMNLANSDDALSLQILGTTMFVGRINGSFESIDISDPTSPSEISSVSAVDDVNDIALDPSGTYAFLATTDNANEFKVVDITDTGSMSVVGNLNAADTLLGVAYDSVTDYAYAVGRSNSEELVVYEPGP